MPLSLTVLGCDGTYPGPGGACSGYLLECEGTRVWLDAGAGTLANLQLHVSIEDLDAVVVTHSHPDHWTDLEHFAVACKWVIGRTGVPVYAPEGLDLLLRIGSAAGVLAWHPVGDAETVRVGAISLTFSRTDHPPPTLAVRADGAGRSLGYSADSGPGWSLASLGPGLHLLLCEATFLFDKEGTLGHMSARQAGASAREAGVERLVITHLRPRVDREKARAEAAAAFGGDVTVAATGDRYVA
ncbi:MAG: MBL fold metallo-hydrolase [Acidimicrobiales bacterium]